VKWLRTLLLFDTAKIAASDEWRSIHDSYVRSIQSLDFPEGSGTLTLRRKKQRPDKQWDRNGVNYLKARFLDHMQREEGWRKEGDVDLSRDRQQPPIKLYPSMEDYREPITSDFGGFDFVTTGSAGGRVAIEWETGNISSSHRSLNKLAIALGNGIIEMGVLILPSRSLYEHLTDRIGNIGELSGYLSMWEGVKASVPKGLLAISVVEQDALTDDGVDYLPRGKDGRSAEGKNKLK